MKFEELENELKNNILPAYIINGGESFLTNEALCQIEKALNINFVDFNKIVFGNYSQSSAKDIINACEIPPFCDEKKIVIVNDFFVKKNESEKKVIFDYLKNPNKQICLVFFSTIKSDFFETLESKIEKIDCDKVSIDYLKSFIDKKTNEYGLKISLTTKEKFLDYCNYSITKINTELYKFKSVILKNNEICDEDIENFITKDIEYIIFDLTAAISQKDSEKAFILIDSMINHKEQPVNIISTITGHFRRLFIISRSDMTNSELASFLNIKEYAVGKYRQQAKNFSQRRLKQIFDKCVEIEFMFKNGKMEGQNCLTYLISEILS